MLAAKQNQKRESLDATGRAGSMLLDILNDPSELKNLSTDPARASTVQSMKSC